MSYTALYRKLRPQTFADVIGQTHIKRTLVNQIQNGRISHAYLFCGTRGTGKTSTAQIFSRAINCESAVDGEPCGECEVCKDISTGRSMSVVEIDAASNNGVDSIRDLREEVKYPPTDCKYKVYIIDEVHMLSTGAFNALLKTLEEPPDHVVFILATTDPQKIPATILSRCQRFDFKRITSADMTARLREFSVSEGIEISDEALSYIAFISDGAMRDAISLLDQCASFYVGESVTLQMVLDIVGSVDNSVFFEFTDCLYNHDSAALIGIINDIVQNGRDIGQFLSELITHFRNLLVSGTNSVHILDYSSDMSAKLRAQGEKIDRQTLIEYITEFSALQSQIRYASNERIILEVAAIKLCNPTINDDNTGLLSRIKKLEDDVDKRISNPIIVEAPKELPHAKQSAEEQPPAVKLEKFIKDDLQHVINRWKTFTEQFTGMAKAFLENAKPDSAQDDLLYIVCGDEMAAAYFKREPNLTLINETLKKFFNIDFNVVFTHKSDYDKLHTRLYGTTLDDWEKTVKAAKESIEFDISHE